jgi:hypothetical protein
MSLLHITIATVGRVPLTRGEVQLRAAVHGLLYACRGRLLLFSIVDDHLHCVVLGGGPGYLARAIACQLRKIQPKLHLQRYHAVEVDGRAHLERLVGYLLRQPGKHDLSGTHSALWSGSCFLDLVGARHLPLYDLSLLRAELPRFRLRTYMPEVGLEPKPVTPCSRDDLRAAGPARIVRLAAAVYALDPALDGAARLHTAARALASHAAAAAGYLPSHIADLLGVTPAAARRLARRPFDTRALAALRRRLTLEDRVGGLSRRTA